eukprot:7379060-Prymnesium_polylepis.1
MCGRASAGWCACRCPVLRVCLCVCVYRVVRCVVRCVVRVRQDDCTSGGPTHRAAAAQAVGAARAPTRDERRTVSAISAAPARPPPRTRPPRTRPPRTRPPRTRPHGAPWALTQTGSACASQYSCERAPANIAGSGRASAGRGASPAVCRVLRASRVEVGLVRLPAAAAVEGAVLHAHLAQHRQSAALVAVAARVAAALLAPAKPAALLGAARLRRLERTHC